MFRYVVNSLFVLALAIWIGSLVFFGAAVAPSIFNPALIASRTQAGAINVAILGRLRVIETVACVIVVGGAVYGVYRTGSWLSWGVLVLALGMTITSLYYNNILFPRLNELRIAIGSFDHVATEKSALHAAFEQGHAHYSLMVKVVLIAGIVALVLHSASLVNYRLRTEHLRWLAESGPFKDHIEDEDGDEDKATAHGAGSTMSDTAVDIASKGEG